MLRRLSSFGRRPRPALPGSALVIAIGITALVFTAVMALAAVVLTSIRSAGNVSGANSAYYAAEASVEQSLYAIVGHRAGFEFPGRTGIEGGGETLRSFLSDEDNRTELVAGESSRGTAAFVIRSRTENIPTGADAWISVRQQSSTAFSLSADASAALEDAAEQLLLVNSPDLQLEVRNLDVPVDEDPRADYRMNTWRGPASSRCYLYASPITLTDPTEVCAGQVGPGVVRPDDPDVGQPLFAMVFGSIACDAADTECGVKWMANPLNGFIPIGGPLAENTSYLPFRDMDLTGTWSEYDTYLLEMADGFPDITPISLNLLAPGQVPVKPEPGSQMLDTTGARIPPVDGDIPVFDLDPSVAVYSTDPADPTSTEVSGALSATGAAVSQTNPDDYLYVDACTLEATDTGFTCTGQPDGRISAPWNLELKLEVFTPGESSPELTLLRRVRSSLDADPCLSHDIDRDVSTVDLLCLFEDAHGAPGDLATEYLASGRAYDVRLTVTTDMRPYELRLVGATEPATTTPAGADEKTTITAVGAAGDVLQTLETTVYQEETLPVFRRTTVF